MKMTRLHLQAFGPFTDTEIVFSGNNSDGSPNLHVIYGPNEAGKSSALRAIADLRFGIPTRSNDDFEHDYRKMRISGVFLDGNGVPIGLTRHKGRGRTLTAFDPATGSILDEKSGIVLLERALTGGLQRAEFEAMYGLTHRRLRQGGELLLQGEGELGAALFEASAGTRSISELLSSLEGEAKALFNPHGRAQTAKINEAKKELDEQRKRLRESQVRPGEWQGLSRDYQEAKAKHLEIDQQLEAARRRYLELTELRSVMPILREQDRLADELFEHHEVPDLVDDARDARLSAQQSLDAAQSAEHSADRDLTRVEEAWSQLRIDTVLLQNEQAIERLHAGVESMLSATDAVAREQVAIDGLQDSLAQRANRIAPEASAQEIISAIPSVADRSVMDDALSELGLARARLQACAQQLKDLDTADQEISQDESAVPDSAARQNVSAAVEAAQALGDTDSRIAATSRNVDQLIGDLHQRLADLGVENVEALEAARPLLFAQIDEASNRFKQWDDDVAALVNSRRMVEEDLERLTLKRSQVEAEGEVVTAETLQSAREKRDKGWSFVRRAYIESTATPAQLSEELGEQKLLPEAFEHLQTEADRQADLLRADSRRAVSYEECEVAISTQQARSDQIGEGLDEIERLHAQAKAEWYETLKEHGLPALSTAGVREWLQRRQGVLEKAAESARVEAERDTLAGETKAKADKLASALNDAGAPVTEKSMVSLLSLARHWIQKADRVEQSLREGAKAKARNQRKREELQSDRDDESSLISVNEDYLQTWSAKLFLAPVVPSATIKARLGELDELARLAQQLADARARRDNSQAAIDLFESRARELAALMKRNEPTNALEFADGVVRELRETEEQERERRDLVRRKREALHRMQDAKDVQQQQEKVLEGLRQAAGVATDEALANIEEKSARKRTLAEALATQRRQLAQASTLTSAVLRERLAGVDLPALDADRERCEQAIERLKDEQKAASDLESDARRRLEAIDASDTAARAREAMESAIARYRNAVLPWARLKLAHALVEEALRRFREKAQAPMVKVAGDYFALISGGRYPRLLADEEGERPTLVAERVDGATIGVNAMSDGTADQLYLALRLAALDLQREAQPDMPLVLDDVLITSDEQRVTNILTSLVRFSEGGQVLLFTHERHLAELARNVLCHKQVKIHELAA